MSLTNATPLDIAQSAREGSRTLAVLKTEERNAALTAIHQALAAGKEEVLAANAKDLEAANKAAAGGTLSASLVKRLDLGKPGKYEDMLQGILDVVELEDPSMFYTESSRSSSMHWPTSTRLTFNSPATLTVRSQQDNRKDIARR